METVQQGILTLIKSAVLGEKLPLPEDFRLEEADGLIRKHSLVALCYEGAFLCGIDRAEPLMRQYFSFCCKNLMVSEAQLSQANRIFTAFEENGIDYLPLKGVNMKKRYPKPELRVMGDADILIRMEHYEKIIPIMEKLGFVQGEETDHELHWHSKGLFVELHKRLIPSYNLDYAAYYGDGWQLARKREGCRYSMTTEDEWIYLFSHFAKHYRDGGIGCRHVTDLWVYLRANPEMDMVYVEAELEKLQLLQFHGNILRLLSAWFEDAAMDEKTEFITQYIFAAGNFGQFENRVLSSGIKGLKTTGNVAGERRKRWQEALIPGHEIIDDQYPVLKEHPKLLPVFWVVRIFDKMLFQQDVVRRRYRSMKVLTRDKLDSHQAALNYVGLDYNF